MAIFFFLVGLEIKREFLFGELKSLSATVLPIAAAVGGMVVPALLYAVFNWGQPTLGGWGVPMATDIAFALGILSFAAGHAPRSVAVFLTALAIVDDLGGIVVIALFYTSSLQVLALAGGALSGFAAPTCTPCCASPSRAAAPARKPAASTWRTSCRCSACATAS